MSFTSENSPAAPWGAGARRSRRWLALVASRPSALAVKGLTAPPSLLAAVAALRRYFPDGQVTESFTCHLAVAFTGSAPSAPRRP